MTLSADQQPIGKAPAAGSRWRHRRGDCYEVVLVANQYGGDDPEKWPVMVVYRSVKLGHVWARRLSEWHNSFEEQDA